MSVLGVVPVRLRCLVERGGQDYLLKAASDPEQNDHIQNEADVLRSCGTSARRILQPVQIGEHGAF